MQHGDAEALRRTEKTTDHRREDGDTEEAEIRRKIEFQLRDLIFTVFYSPSLRLSVLNPGRSAGLRAALP
jgi:hypothetical protein